MLSLDEKIHLLQRYLFIEETFADSYKGEICCIIGDFDKGNPILAFLEKLVDEESINQFINRFTSRIVMKYDPELESLGDFFWDYVENG